MRHVSRIVLWLALGVLLVACGQSALRPETNLPTSPTATPVNVAAIQTAAAAAVRAQMTGTVAAFTPTPIPFPTRIPTIDPTKIPSLLQSAFSIRSLATFNGHGLRQITGWAYGFSKFDWPDVSHLILYAVVGPQDLEQFYLEPNYPAVLNLDTKRTWVPEITKDIWSEPKFNPTSLTWWPNMGGLITSRVTASGNVVEIHGLDGNLIKSYPGKLLSVSPSGTKILVDNGTWIDLISRKTVDFTWSNQYFDDELSIPVWSADETRVFTCCDVYGNARTGKSYGFQSYLFFTYGSWILNDTCFLPKCCFIADLGPGYVPLIDPAAKNMRNLNELAEIPAGDPNGDRCNRWYLSPPGKYVWVECFGESYLVDLDTFKSQVYPDYPLGSFIEDINWSKDGSFALLDIDDHPDQILSVTNKEIKPVKKDYICGWHPTVDRLLCRSYDGKSLALMDAQTGSIQKEVALPVGIQDTIWSPDGKQIALLARDSSIWKTDYPNLDHLEQLTPAMPELTRPVFGVYLLMTSLIKNLAWSPDGASLAFIGGKDIYIVDTK